MAKVAMIVGVGPGLGVSLARRFGREGFALALIARSEHSLDPIQQELTQAGSRVLSIAADATDPTSVGAAFAQVREQLGAPQVLIYNAGAFQVGGILELSPEQFEQAWRINCFGAFLAAQQVLPVMVEQGEGTVLLTGATAALRSGARFAGLAVGKFGLRALAQSLAREFGPQGIHVAHIVIDGQIDTPRVQAMAGPATGMRLDPEAIAETYWQLHCQPESAWTQELDLRPASEKF